MSLFLLDSGAFSVWNRGETIDLDAYIEFCARYPQCSYYVNLDVIPGKPNDVKSLTPSAIESACQMSWDNYQKMLETLPFEKVVPVFHMNDGFHWLEKYLDFGTPYLGISPANDRTTSQKFAWLKEVEQYITNSDGTAKIKTHGFAVTSFRLMKCFPFHSVDSASWVRHSAYGTVYIPMKRNGEWDYSIDSFQLSVSPKSPTRDERQRHITTLTPYLRSLVDEYLAEIKMPLGEFKIVEVSQGYKKQKGELWYEKGKKDKVLRTVKKGAMTCHQRRFYMNARFLKLTNDVINVDHIYFAGAGGSLRDEIEFKLGRRLMSYHEIMVSKAARKAFETHMEMLSGTVS